MKPTRAVFSVPKNHDFVEFFALFGRFVFEKTLPHTTGMPAPPAVWYGTAP
jgi:hypothetical protein